MEKIELKEINFNKLNKIECTYHSEGNLYHDKNRVYKLFKSPRKKILIQKQRKIELLSDGKKIPNVIMPIDGICSGTKFRGYTMKYINNSIALYDNKKINKDYQRLLPILLEVSQIVKKIHHDSRNIVVGDLSFHNIIVDNNSKPFFVDIDSCKISNLNNEKISALLYGLYKDKNINNIEINKDSDKLSLLLSFLDIIFEKNILNLNMHKYDELAEKIETLKNIKSILINLKYKKYIPKVPYLHELISDKDIKTRKRI